MAYVQRDASGAICGVYGCPQAGFATEFVADDNTALATFLLRSSSAPPAVLPQDLMAQFTQTDATAIQTAIAGNIQFWLLWNSMVAQRDPMQVTNARFKSGWSALVSVLGQPRMDAIASALGVTVT